MSMLVRGMILIAAGVASTAAAAGSLPPPGAEYFPETDASTMNLPFSEAVRVGNMLYLYGAIGTDKTAKLVAGGMVALGARVEVQCNATL